MSKRKPNLLSRSRRSVKGDLPGPGVMLQITLVMLVLGIMMYFIITTWAPAAEIVGGQALKLKMEACRMVGDRTPQLLRNDKKNENYVYDVYPNVCDICPYFDSSLSKDTDGDGMPDDCDITYDDPSKAGCDSARNLRWDKKKYKCLCKTGDWVRDDLRKSKGKCVEV